ncbi:hypothetical protein M404DRAFT_1009391 [Pisolithus tinctorius Marx 270]|uniref:Uncharacterized protein n=1 Tax=Pisolithus tinctorius Marx 270 TaxID=870435 RepID=A0A0C3N9U3_PISTI|nr:hypothetical protein M404DRAFT_1009391 [Pisolithus tinctorius Marx 270]
MCRKEASPSLSGFKLLKHVQRRTSSRTLVNTEGIDTPLTAQTTKQNHCTESARHTNNDPLGYTDSTVNSCG